jgi:hypothetical protein
MASASAGQSTIDSTGEKVWDDTGGCTSFSIRCIDTGAQDALVNIEGLHDDAEFFRIPKGEEQTFRFNDLSIREVFVKGNGGDTIVWFGVVAKTQGD